MISYDALFRHGRPRAQPPSCRRVSGKAFVWPGLPPAGPLSPSHSVPHVTDDTLLHTNTDKGKEGRLASDAREAVLSLAASLVYYLSPADLVESIEASAPAGRKDREGCSPDIQMRHMATVMDSPSTNPRPCVLV